MPNWLELLLLAFASMFWPTLIVIVVLALQLAKPVRILAWFLAGGLLTTIGIGIAVVFALQSRTNVTHTPSSTNGAVSIIVGLLSLVVAFALHREGLKPHDDTVATHVKPSRVERVVEHGAPVAFLSGVVLNIVPGTFPIIALKDIAQLDLSNAATVATITAFYVIMFAFVEVPVVTYLFAPERTTAAVSEFNMWLTRNGRRLCVYVLAGFGLYLVVRGVVEFAD